MSGVFIVRWEKKVVKQLNRVPTQIARKFYAWVSAVNMAGIEEVRRSPGFHDEPLHGKRKGQRSVRLNRSYRVIYEIADGNKVKIVEVLEITNHEY